MNIEIIRNTLYKVGPLPPPVSSAGLACRRGAVGRADLRFLLGLRRAQPQTLTLGVYPLTLRLP